MKLLNMKLLKGNLLVGIVGVAGLGLLTLSSLAHAQPPSPYAVETNLHGIYAYTQPPPTFDPTTASDDELQLYGYPPRPGADATPQDRAQWAAVTNPNLNRIVPQLVHTNIYHRPAAGLREVSSSNPSSKKYTSTNWSGYALAHKKPAFTSVTGSWTVPPVQQAFGSCSDGWDYSSQWVGIDGLTNSLLFQAGSEADAYCSGGSTSELYRPWIEWLPESEIVLTYSNGDPLPFAPGDYLIVTVTATGWSNGQSSTGTLLYTDVTQNWQASEAVTAASLGGTYIVGDSAEWIVERPEVDGSLANLANYIADPWFYATATDVKKIKYYAGTPKTAATWNLTMEDETGTAISYVNLFGTQVMWFFDENSAF
ncbi:MAG TPA: G1 family glutamic endopeptidase [Candidatus Binataceae bacterium]|nr:G1 family glutamic endopeptidase [Candidatus Binataceae bacterium]